MRDILNRVLHNGDFVIYKNRYLCKYIEEEACSYLAMKKYTEQTSTTEKIYMEYSVLKIESKQAVEIAMYNKLLNLYQETNYGRYAR